MSAHIPHLSVSHRPVFLLNSCLSLFSAAHFRGHPFSRSYGVILPSSLTMLLPSALGFSPHPPVSVYGTGTVQTIAAFLGSRLTHFPTLVRYASHLWVARRFFQPYPSCACPWIPFQVVLSFCVPTVLSYCSTGISTCCPSATPLGLALGPDFPRADQLYPGNLGYSAVRILTLLSLLIPAFSLHSTPLRLPVQLRRAVNAPLPISRFLSFGVVF